MEGEASSPTATRVAKPRDVTLDTLLCMVHVESGSQPPSWPQNEVKVLIN